MGHRRRDAAPAGDDAAARRRAAHYFLPPAGMGLLYHRKNGLLDRELLRRTVPWGLLAAAGGALLASIIDLTLLRRIFGIYLLAAGVSMLLPSQKG